MASEIEANRLFKALMDGEKFSIDLPDFSGPEWKLPYDANSDLYKPVEKMTVDRLTEGKVDGSGVFDQVMASLKAHLKEEYDNDRITASEYVKAYIAMTEAALAQSVQFLTQQDQAYWAAVLAQAQAITAKVQLVSAQVEAARIQLTAKTAQADYALTKLKLSTEDTNYSIGQYNLTNIMPLQKDGQKIQNDTGTYTLGTMLPGQFKLVQEQTEAQRGQTSDTRTDGQPVKGLVGKQKDLYSQQIDSYKRDIEIKASKIWTDLWSVMKTMDESLLPPTQLANSNIDTILGTIRANNQLG